NIIVSTMSNDDNEYPVGTEVHDGIGPIEEQLSIEAVDQIRTNPRLRSALATAAHSSMNSSNR
ncbi:unnamed protein product, partial [Didymodactylos carnosus]